MSLNLDQKKTEREQGSTNQSQKTVKIGLDAIDDTSEPVPDDIVKAGSVIGLVVDPLSMGETLSYRLFDTDNRTTYYLSLNRKESDVKADINSIIASRITDNDTVTDGVGETQEADAAIGRAVDGLDQQQDLVVNPFTPEHIGPDNLLTEYRRIKTAVQSSGSIAYLVIPTTNHDTLTEPMKDLCHVLDGIFTVTRLQRSTDVIDQLEITKLRNSQRPDQAFKLDFDGSATVSNTQEV